MDHLALISVSYPRRSGLVGKSNHFKTHLPYTCLRTHRELMQVCYIFAAARERFVHCGCRTGKRSEDCLIRGHVFPERVTLFWGFLFSIHEAYPAQYTHGQKWRRSATELSPCQLMPPSQRAHWKTHAKIILQLFNLLPTILWVVLWSVVCVYTHSKVINPVTYVESYIYDTSVCQLPIVSVQRREYEQFIPFQNTIKKNLHSVINSCQLTQYHSFTV